MASLENTILDFDLELFNPNTIEKTSDETTLATRIEKQRKTVSIVKRKIIATNALIERYYDKRTALDLSARLVTTSKEECKQICIDYRNSLDTCTKLENDIQAIQATNKQLEEKCFHAVSQYEALQSHTHQLQMLIKDHEETIDSLKATKKIENKLPKDFERKLSSFEKRNTTLLKHLHTFSKILLGKQKLTRKHKALLKEYEKRNKANTSESSHDEDSDAHEDISQCLSPYSSFGSPPNTLEIAKFCEAGSVGTSIDTGRGSSLADSNDNSIDCFISNSPGEIIENKQNPKVCSIALSPIPTQMVEIATSPVQMLAERHEIFKPTVKVNRSTSPRKIINSVTVATSPIRNISKEVATSPFKKKSNKPLTKAIQSQEKECLEINNSKNLCVEDNTELEIEMILDVMRWDHIPVTPIPVTPVASICTEHTNGTQTNGKQVDNVRDVRCQDALLLREENKKILAHIDHLSNEINFIKKTLHKNNIGLENNQEELIDSLPVNNVGNISHDEDCNLDASGANDIGEQIPQSVEKPISEPVLLPSIIITNENNIEMVENNVTANKNPKLQIIFEPDETRYEINKPEPLPKTQDKHQIVPANTKIIVNKKRKLSKLDKIKKTLKPKYKIKTAPSQPTVKKFKKINSQLCIQKPIKNGNSSASLNDKAIYEKAIKVMAELKRKEATDKSRASPRKSITIKKTETKQLPYLVLEKLELSPNYRKNLEEQNIVSSELDNQMLDNLNDEETSHESIECKQFNLSEKPCLKRLRTISTRAEKEPHNLVGLSTNANSPKSNKSKNQEESVILEDSQMTKKILRSTLKDQSLSLPEPNLNKNLGETWNKSKNQEESVILEDSQMTKKILRSTLKDQSLSLPEPNLNKNLGETWNEINSVQSKKPLNQQLLSPRSIMTRSSRRAAANNNTYPEIHNGFDVTSCANMKKEKLLDHSDNILLKNVSPPENVAQLSRKRSRRSYDSEEQPKRVLRSATIQQRLSTDSLKQNDIIENTNSISTSTQVKEAIQDTSKLAESSNHFDNEHGNIRISYNDLDVSTDKIPDRVVNQMSKPIKDLVNTENTVDSYKNPKDSILCTMLTKYGVNRVRPKTRKVTGSTINTIYTKLENDIAKIIKVNSSKTQELMNYLVVDLQMYNYKDFVTALIKYLEQPQRKTELYGKHSVPPAPAMTKSEQVLLYVISKLQVQWAEIDIVDIILSNIEYALFKLNRFPEFEIIETMSHFYAVLCKYFRAKSRLRTFILDAMYCLQFKAIPLIKECLDVWMHVIPLAHMGTAKNPLVTILVYLLHFYKCEDRLNRVRELRFILSKRYFYKITEWNDAKMIETLRSTIKDLKDIPIEKKMLRLALIILAKRQGPKWCQKNLIINLLQPFITKKDISENAKEFCISMIGPLMKPYPAEMKVYCEIAINQLGNIMNENASHRIQEAVIKSMMLINRHNQHGVNQILLTTNMKVSADLEETLCYYVRTKPLYMWKKILMRLVQT